MAISTFMGLETNKRGLTAQQTALYTVGHNISNANTVGYTRQRVNLEATHGFPGVGMNAPMLAGHLGTGVTSQSITRVRNEFVDKQYRQETNNLGYWSQRTDAISQMEDIMAEPSPYGLNAGFDEFYTAWQNLANSPSSSAARQVVYTKASHLASSFNYMNKQMTQVQQNLKSEAIKTTNNINSILDRIASLNNQIKQVEPNGYIPNELYDARDVLLDELSQYVPISTERLYSGGLATDDAEGALNVYLVKADGSKEPLVLAEETGSQSYNGVDRPLYGNSVASKLSLTTGVEGVGSGIQNITEGNSELFEAFSGISLSKVAKEALKATTDEDGNATLNAGGVAVKANADGSIEVTDSEGNDLNPTIDPDTGVITISVPEEVDADGNITTPASTMTIKLTKDSAGNVTGGSLETATDAKNIGLKDLTLEKGKLTSFATSYGYTTGELDADGEPIVKGFYHEKINQLDKLAYEFAKKFNEIHVDGHGLTTPENGGNVTGELFFDGVDPNETDEKAYKGAAAAMKINDKMKDFNNIAASSRPNEEGNGDLALKLSNLKTTAIEGLNNTSAGKFYESMVADVGTEGEKSTQMAYNSATIQLTISKNRSSVSSVSLDEEMTNMIMFQQAYNASARMMTAIDEILDKVINGMGRVGL